MASTAQIDANRSNAQKSTGPRTPEGKAAVAQNAVKHGLLARAAVLQGEDWEEYTCFHEEMMDELYPDAMQEEELAERIVDLSWRLRRAGRYQNAVFEALYDQYAAAPAESAAWPDPIPSVPSDPVLGRMLLADFSGARVLERVLLYERRLESSLYRTTAALRNLRRVRKEGAPKAEAVGSVPVRAYREVSSGKSQVSSESRASTPPASNFPLRTADSASEFELAWQQDRAWNPPLPPTPEGGVSSLTCQVSSEQGPAASPPGLGTSNFTVETAAEPLSCETKPISARAIKDGDGYRPIFRRRR